MSLANKRSEMKAFYEVVVIGSGYGGSIAASRFAEKGYEVCILERGKEYKEGDFPKDGIQALTQFQSNIMPFKAPNRLLDMKIYEDAAVLVGSGLGGTSLINAGVTVRPEPKLFEDPRWPEEIRKDCHNFEAIYQKVERFLDVQIYPGGTPGFQHLPRIKKMGKLANLTGHKFKSVPVAVNFKAGFTNIAGQTMKACVGCGSCITGCNFGAKNTLDKNYLPHAKKLGANIFTQICVSHVKKIADFDYEVYFWDVPAFVPQAKLKPSDLKVVRAQQVVLAAGAMGSPEILLRSRDMNKLALSPQIGKGFSLNSGTIALIYNSDFPVHTVGFSSRKRPDRRLARDDRRNSSEVKERRTKGRFSIIKKTWEKFHFARPVGPTITSMIDCRDMEGAESRGFVVEDAAIPAALRHILPMLWTFSGFTFGKNPGDLPIKKLMPVLRSLMYGANRGATRNSFCLLGVGFDKAKGELMLDSRDHQGKDLLNDRLQLHWPSLKYETNYIDIHRYVERMCQELGGIFVDYKGLGLGRPISVHPLGGCKMGDNFSKGVVNAKGQVLSGETDDSVHQGLYVMDASILPMAVGSNPLLLISTLAERAMNAVADKTAHKHLFGLPNTQAESVPDKAGQIQDLPRNPGKKPIPVRSLRLIQSAWEKTRSQVANSAVTPTLYPFDVLEKKTTDGVQVKIFWFGRPQLAETQGNILIVGDFGQDMLIGTQREPSAMVRILLQRGFQVGILETRYSPNAENIRTTTAYTFDQIARHDIPDAMELLKPKLNSGAPLHLMGIGLGGMICYFSAIAGFLPRLASLTTVNLTLCLKFRSQVLARRTLFQKIEKSPFSKGSRALYEKHMEKIFDQQRLIRFHRRKSDQYTDLPQDVMQAALAHRIPTLLISSNEGLYRQSQKETFAFLEANNSGVYQLRQYDGYSEAQLLAEKNFEEVVLPDLQEFFEKFEQPAEVKSAVANVK